MSMSVSHRGQMFIGSDAQTRSVCLAVGRLQTLGVTPVRNRFGTISGRGSGRYANGCLRRGRVASAGAGSGHLRARCAGAALSGIGRAVGFGQRCFGRVGCASRVVSDSYRHGSPAAGRAAVTGIDCCKGRIHNEKNRQSGYTGQRLGAVARVLSCAAVAHPLGGSVSDAAGLGYLTRPVDDVRPGAAWARL